MLNQTITGKLLFSIFSMTLFLVNTNALFAFQITDKAGPDLASISVKRKVSVNNQPAVSNFTVASGDRIVTGDDASAVINLTGIGRIELFSSTILVINFTKDGVSPELFDGKIHVVSDALKDAKVTTPNGVVVAEKGKSKSFTVEIGCSDECTETFSEVFVNSVTMNVNKDNVVKNVTEGTIESSGPLSNECTTYCEKPIIALKGGSNAGLIFLISGIGAALIAAIFLSGSDNNGNPPTPPNRPVSPFS